MKLIHIDEPRHSRKVIEKQAEAILKIKPDIILFELPRVGELSYFNKFKPKNKPHERIDNIKEHFSALSKYYPWFASFYKIIEAVEQLWSKGKQVYLYEIDGPVELTSAGEGKRGVQNVVWNYLREKFMLESIKRLNRRFPRKKALLFCHNFHWGNLNFLLKKPSKKEIWNHYFKIIGNVTPEWVERELRRKNKVLYKYWKKLGFR